MCYTGSFRCRLEIRELLSNYEYLGDGIPVVFGVEKGLRFAIREGGRTVGAGVVSEVIQ